MCVCVGGGERRGLYVQYIYRVCVRELDLTRLCVIMLK